MSDKLSTKEFITEDLIGSLRGRADPCSRGVGTQMEKGKVTGYDDTLSLNQH